MLFRLPRSTAMLALAFAVCHPAVAEEPKTTRYLSAVVGCLDTLVKDCTDTYGSEHSPLLCSLVDLKTHRIPEKAPPLLREQRKHDRAYPGGNLQHDLFTLLAMYHTTKLTGQKRFAEAADAYLGFFLRRCASAGNGLFPYGEHAFWDFRKETVGGLPIHEDLAFVPKQFLDRLWTINPKATAKHIRQLEMHFLDGQDCVWNRHAQIFGSKRPTRPAAFPRHGGFYIYQQCYLYSKNRDPSLLALARRTADAKRKAGKANLSVLSLGLSLLRANQELLGKDTIANWETFGRECLNPIVEATKEQPRQGRIMIFVPYRQKPLPNRTYGYWDKVYEGSGGYAFVGAEKLSLMCLCAYRLTGSQKHLKYARDVADCYLTLDRPAAEPITPGKFGGLIALSLDLHDITGERKYLQFAQQNADWAVDELYSHGLFRAATGKDYYEAANGVGPLLIELLRLHLLLTGSEYEIPRYYAET